MRQKRSRHGLTRRTPPAAGAALALLVLLVAGCSSTQPEGPEAVARSYLEARATWDADAALDLFADDATIDDATIAFRETSTAEQASAFEFFQAVDWRETVEQCVETTSGPRSEVTCTYTFENAWTGAIGVEPITGSFDFIIADGLIVDLTHNFNLDDFGPVWSAVEDWLLGNHRDDAVNVMYNAGRTHSQKTPESLALWEQYTQEFVASQPTS